jgi:dTDP-4-amino-4,6-dideoxygalactose transaminase
MKIPLGKPYIKTNVVLEEIKKVLDGRWISGGPTITEFENKVKEYNKDLDGRYIAVSNGTVAIELALLYLNDGKFYSQEDEIITTSWSWVATGFSVPRVGAKPVWCDVNQYGVPFAEDIQKRITPKTKAIIVVHQMGVPANMDKINALRDKYNIPIIEDAACAIGSEYKGKRIGNSDNMVTYSFQARKVLTTGEGGMIVVRNEEAEKWLRSYRAFGTNTTPYLRDRSDKLIIEYFDKLGGNYKMSDISAAVGIAHLKYIDEEIDLRTKAAEYYNIKVKELNMKYGGIFIGNIIPEYCTRYNWQNYHIILDKTKYYRDDIIKFLKQNGVGCKWDIQAIHLEPAMKTDKRDVLTGTAVFHSYGLWLPFFAEITKEEQDYALQILEEVVSAFQ